MIIIIILWKYYFVKIFLYFSSNNFTFTTYFQFFSINISEHSYFSFLISHGRTTEVSVCDGWLIDGMDVTGLS